MYGNIHLHFNGFQTRPTEQNFMLINLILSELAIAMFGIPPDLYNSITRGEALGSFFCPSFGFVHTFFGNYSIQN